MTKEASSTIGSIMVMIVCCLMLSLCITIYRVPSLVLDLLMGITTNKYLLLFIIDIFLFLVGMIVNDTTGVLICAPLLMPVMTQLGVSPVHFAAIMGRKPGNGRSYTTICKYSLPWNANRKSGIS
mgnify:CR=1 FL=1